MVNDMPLLILNRSTSINTEIPGNTFLYNGINEFTCKIIPPRDQDVFSESAFVKISVIEGSASNANASREINVFKTPSFKPEEGSEPYRQYSLEGKFSASIFYLSALPGGINFNISEYLQNELFQAYTELWNAFRVKDIDTVMRKLTLKIKETAGLKGSSLIEMEKEMRGDYISYMNNSSLQLWEFTIDKVFLKIYGRNKLACLEVRNGNQPLCYINRADHLAIYIPVYFYRNSQTQLLEVIR